MHVVPLVSVVVAVLGLLVAWYLYVWVRKADPGNERMVEIMTAIRDGSKAFLRREYLWVAGFVVVTGAAIAIFLPDGVWRAFALIAGAAFSGLAGYVGMMAATMANARTTEAARIGTDAALPVAFRGGAIMGFTVSGLSLLGVALAYLVFSVWFTFDNSSDMITSYLLGCGLVALTARIGGGIYTKAADVGADLVGKVEAGIPEDDPRNPATIADNVGDNVGDVAGMGADLFESHGGSIIAPMILAGLLFAGRPEAESALLFPLAIGAVGLVASILSVFVVRAKRGADQSALAKALHRGTNLASLITVIGVFALGWWMFAEHTANWWGLPLAVIAGLVVGVLLGQFTEYFTSDSHRPVKTIAAASETGAATNLLAGIAAGKRSVVGAVVLVAAGIVAAYAAGQVAFPDLTSSGVYGVAIAGIGMLATLGMVVSTDTFGPIADNAGGIAEMAGLPPEVRKVTDSLDSLGNTTAAVAKGFAIGSAALTALALFVSFQHVVETARIDAGVAAADAALVLGISEVWVFVGLFVGVSIPLWFAARTITSVGVAANQMIEEVRRQFREIPGLREGHPDAKPDYTRCVDISTQSALRQMLLPGVVAVVVPVIVGFLSIDALGGLLAGVLASGFAMAVYMANSGGAWDNAKKYIEAGAHGGKGSDPHAAAVVGDTVGDPFKDTSGPAMNTLIKLMTVVALIFAPALIALGLG